MAAALFAGHQRFARISDGRWRLRGRDVPHGVVRRRDATSSTRSRSSSSTSRRRARARTAATVSPSRGRPRAGRRRDDRVRHARSIPSAPIPPSVTARHEHHVGDGAPRAAFAEVCDQLLGVLEGHVFVAHNARLRLALHLDGGRARDAAAARSGRRLCTVRHGAQARAAAAPPQSRRGHGALRHRELTRGIAPAATPSRRRTCSFACSMPRGIAAARRSTIVDAARAPAPRAAGGASAGAAHFHIQRRTTRTA